MTAPERNGKVPTPEEFFDHCLLLADLVEQSLLDAQALRDETRRTLLQIIDRVGSGNDQSLEKIQNLSKKLERLYAPDAVRKAAQDAQKAVGSFSGNLSSIFKQIADEAKTASTTFWLRTGGVAAIVLIGMLALTGLAVTFVPSLDEIKARRAEIAAIDAKVVDYQGGKWVPISDTAKRCSTSNLKDCVQYARIK